MVSIQGARTAEPSAWTPSIAWEWIATIFAARYSIISFWYIRPLNSLWQSTHPINKILTRKYRTRPWLTYYRVKLVKKTTNRLVSHQSLVIYYTNHFTTRSYLMDSLSHRPCFSNHWMLVSDIQPWLWSAKLGDIPLRRWAIMIAGSSSHSCAGCGHETVKVYLFVHG